MELQSAFVTLSLSSTLRTVTEPGVTVRMLSEGTAVLFRMLSEGTAALFLTIATLRVYY